MMPLPVAIGLKLAPRDPIRPGWLPRIRPRLPNTIPTIQPLLNLAPRSTTLSMCGESLLELQRVDGVRRWAGDDLDSQLSCAPRWQRVYAEGYDADAVNGSRFRR
jgi:hypothetical protein